MPVATVVVGVGAAAGTTVAAPALAAAAATIASATAVAAIYQKTCQWMIEAHQTENCRDQDWFHLHCATIRTLATVNCGILAGAVGTIVITSGGVLSEFAKPYANTLAKFSNLGIKK